MQTFSKLIVSCITKYGIAFTFGLAAFHFDTPYTKAAVFSCHDIFKISNRAVPQVVPKKSSISDFHLSSKNGPVVRDLNVLVIALHSVDSANTKVEGRSFFSKIKNIFPKRFSSPLQVIAYPQSHTTKFKGVIEKGSTQTIHWQLPPTSLKTPYSRKHSIYTGLQLSLDFQGDLTKASIVLHAKPIGSEQRSESLKFVGSFPVPLKQKLKNDEAPSYLIDFDNLVSEKFNKLSFSDFRTDFEIVGVGLSFNANHEPLKIEGSIYGEIHFISDLSKSSQQFRQHLNKLSNSELVKKLIVEELPFLNTTKLHDIAQVLKNDLDSKVLESIQDPSLLDRYALGEYHSFLYKMLLLKKSSLIAVDREILISLFEKRPTMIFEPITRISPNGNLYSSVGDQTSFDITRTIVDRLYDEKRQLKTIQVAKSEGIEKIKTYLDNLGFEAKPLEFVEPHILWEAIAPYRRNTFGRFGIPTDAGAFGADHGEYSHLLQIYTIVEGMSPEELLGFKSIFNLMQTEQYLFLNLWTLFFDASGSASPNSPRYWRDLMAD